MEDFNLHLTGDIHAVSLANNLAAAFVDNHIYHENPLDIDPYGPSLRRVVDVSDSWALSEVITGLGSGIVRKTGFDIAVASEVMAILGLTRGLQDIRQRLARMVIATKRDGSPVTCEDLKVAGAMAVLMKDAIKPNLMQTLEHTPCFVHAGPFANIAHGNSSIIADFMATKLADFTVTESGFGADIGMEKFMNIKCRASGLVPDCVVLVASVRALKMHSGKFKVVAGKPLDDALIQENPQAVAEGCPNLEKQIENVLAHGVPCVVAINQFTTDTEKEFVTIAERAKAAGAYAVVRSNVWAEGGKGGAELAEAVVDACEAPKQFKFLYEADWPIKKKIETIATRMYGAAKVIYEKPAEVAIERFTKFGYDKLPICMAKTHLSLSHDPALKGRPTGFTFPVRDVRASVVRGIPVPAVRGDADDARPSDGAGGREGRPRPRRPRGGIVLVEGRCVESLGFGFAPGPVREEECRMPEIVEIPVVWLQGAACTGCAVSLLNAFSPGIAQVLLRELAPGKHLSLRFLATVMAGQGTQVMDVLRDTAVRSKGGYVLVMEGAIQLGDPLFATLGEAAGDEIPIAEHAAGLARDALAVVNMGTCASFAGVPAAAPDPTKSVSMVEFMASRGIRTPVVNIPGCPPHPDWLLGTLTAVMLYGLEAVAKTLDDLGRPTMYYGKCIHETCPRRADFDAARFARKFGDAGCMHEMGCKGPVTFADCPTRMWNSGTNWCIGAGSPCHGCVEPDFPDRLSPLYQKINEERLNRFRLLQDKPLA